MPMWISILTLSISLLSIIVALYNSRKTTKDRNRDDKVCKIQEIRLLAIEIAAYNRDCKYELKLFPVITDDLLNGRIDNMWLKTHELENKIAKFKELMAISARVPGATSIVKINDTLIEMSDIKKNIEWQLNEIRELSKIFASKTTHII